MIGADDPFEDLERRLADERPLPAPGFRAALRRGLIENPRGSRSPKHLRLLIGAYAGSGVVLMAVVAVGLIGVGPFAVG